MNINKKLEINNLTVIKNEDDLQFYTSKLVDKVPIYYKMKFSDIKEIKIEEHDLIIVKNNEEICNIVKCSYELHEKYLPGELNYYGKEYIENLWHDNIDSFELSCIINNPIIVSSISDTNINVDLIKNIETLTMNVKSSISFGTVDPRIYYSYIDTCYNNLVEANNIEKIINNYLNEIREQIINFLNN